jgi:NDP-sugar pyrophosphorylase family protein
VQHLAYAGDRAWVHKSSILKGNVVLCNDTLVDRGTEIKNSIILPNSYIGRNLRIENSIVQGMMLIRVDLGIVTKIEDDQLISELIPEQKAA